jgi:hypothetical protein
MRNFAAVVLLASAAVAACTRSSSEGTEAASSTPTPPRDSTRPSSSDARFSGPGAGSSPTSSACPRTGTWALCSVEKRLEQSGFVVRRIDVASPHRAGFSVTPAVYTLGPSRLEVFIYPDAAALSADVAKIDTASATPRGAPSQWEAAPTFVRSGNLAAVFLTDNATQAERLTLALTAGAPQR